MGHGESETSEKSGTARHPRTTIWLVTLAFLLVGLPAAWHVSSWPTRLRYPGELNDIEGMRLAEMLHVRRGIPIYAPATPRRFDAAIYGPLYYLLGAKIIDPNKPAYLPLRLLSLLATLGCAVGCAFLAFWLGRSYLAAVFAPLLVLGFGFVTHHGLSVRSDAVALLLVLWGFIVAYRFQRSSALLLASPLMLLGFFYKQQFVAAPLAVGVFLLLERRYRLALQFASLLALGGLASFAFFQFVVFRGEAFFSHFLLYNLVPFSWTEFGWGLVFFGLVLLIPVLMGVEFLRLCPDRLLSCYLGCATLLSLLTFGKEGSDSNYFLELVFIVSCLFAALLAMRIEAQAGVVELLVLVGVTLFFGQCFTPPSPSPEDFRRDRAIQDFLRHKFPPGTEALGHYAGDLVRAGLETPISDTWQYSALIRNGTFSDQDLLVRVQGHCFGVIVSTFDLKDEPEGEGSSNYLNRRLRRAICENYQLDASLPLPWPESLGKHSERFDVWVPRPGPEAASRSFPCD